MVLQKNFILTKIAEDDLSLCYRALSNRSPDWCLAKNIVFMTSHIISVDISFENTQTEHHIDFARCLRMYYENTVTMKTCFQTLKTCFQMQLTVIIWTRWTGYYPSRNWFGRINYCPAALGVRDNKKADFRHFLNSSKQSNRSSQECPGHVAIHK
jgi:hypothetical protein